MLLGLTIDGFGAHPSAWRLTPGDPRRVWRAGHALDLTRRAEAAAVDFVLFPDAPRSDESRARLDPVLLAARLAPATTAIGLVAETAVTHREPFHISKAIATLDHVSLGRAGWAVTIDATPEGAARTGLAAAPDADTAWREARDVIEVVRALWDSWEDDAVIRDLGTGRFVDRDKLHYVDFVGEFFSIKGPSITPRPPQGRPPVLVRADEPAAAIAVTGADAAVGTGSGADGIRLTELVVTVAVRAPVARHRAAVLAESDESPAAPPCAAEFVGSAHELADRIAALGAECEGVLLRPAVNAVDIPVITDVVIPELVARGVLPGRYAQSQLRTRFGLGPAANRYAA